MDNRNGAQVDFNSLLDVMAERIAAAVCAKLEAPRPLRPRLLDLKQAALYLGRTGEGVRKLATSGRLPCVRPDGRLQFDIQDLDRWIEQSKEQ